MAKDEILPVRRSVSVGGNQDQTLNKVDKFKIYLKNARLKLAYLDTIKYSYQDVSCLFNC